MRTLLRIIGVLLIVAAIILFSWSHIRSYVMTQINERMIEAFQNGESTVDVNPIEEWIATNGQQDAPDQEIVSVDEKEDLDGIDHEDPSKHQTDYTEIGDSMVAFIKVPSVGINEPILKGPATVQNLYNGVVFVEEDDSLDDQNIAIAGHKLLGTNMRFSNLADANIGAKVIIVTRDGEREFEITNKKHVKPNDVSVLEEQQGEPTKLTLVTCDDYDPNTGLFLTRTIITAKEA